MTPLRRAELRADLLPEVGRMTDPKKLNRAGGARGRRSSGLSVSLEPVAYHEASSADMP